MSPRTSDSTIDPDAFGEAINTVMTTFADESVRAAAIATLSTEQRAAWAAAFRYVADHLDPMDFTEADDLPALSHTAPPLSPWTGFTRIGHA